MVQPLTPKRCGKISTRQNNILEKEHNTHFNITLTNLSISPELSGFMHVTGLRLAMIKDVEAADWVGSVSSNGHNKGMYVSVFAGRLDFNQLTCRIGIQRYWSRRTMIKKPIHGDCALVQSGGSDKAYLIIASLCLKPSLPHCITR